MIPNPKFESLLFSFSLYVVMLTEVLQVLRGASKVGSALITTQGEQLRLITCNSSLGGGVKVAQDVVEGLVGTFMGSSNEVKITNYLIMKLIGKCILGYLVTVLLLVQSLVSVATVSKGGCVSRRRGMGEC